MPCDGHGYQIVLAKHCMQAHAAMLCASSQAFFLQATDPMHCICEHCLCAMMNVETAATALARLSNTK